MPREESARIADEKRRQARTFADPYVRGTLTAFNKAKETAISSVAYLDRAYLGDLAMEACRLAVHADEAAARCERLLEQFQEEVNRNGGV